MLPFRMFRDPRLVPPSQPLCETSVGSASPRYRFSASLIFKPSTVNHSSLGFLPRIDAKLTRVNHNPFVCHSYKKHPGVGYARAPLFPRTSCVRTATAATHFLSWVYFMLLWIPRGRGTPRSGTGRATRFRNLSTRRRAPAPRRSQSGSTPTARKPPSRRVRASTA
jgi:hypothetical protein